MNECLWLVLPIIIGWLVYLMLPHAACVLKPNLALCRIIDDHSDTETRSTAILTALMPLRWQNKLARHLRLAGFADKSAVNKYLGILLSVFLFMLLASLAIGGRGPYPLMLGVVMVSAVNSWISKRIRSRKKAFTIALYKIYRFLDLQLTAGLKMTDSLRGLPDAVPDKVVHPVLVRFAARYELTLDFEQAFNEIRSFFGGTDCELMATHLHQCLQTGEAGKSLHRMEDLLFAKYFSLMQADTQKIRFRLLLTALLGILPCAALFMLPLLYQAIQAMKSVFG